MGIRLLVTREKSVGFEEYLPYIIVAVGAVIATALTMQLMRGQKKNETTLPLKTFSEPTTKWPFKTEHTISQEAATKAREKLRIHELEREVLSDAIRRLYEAHVEGKITEKERDMLAERYKSRMLKIKDAISKSQSVVALQELEAMQGDLVKLFDERFNELSMKVEEMRSKVEIEPEKEEVIIPVEIEAPATEEEAPETPEVSAEQRLAKRKKPRPKTPPTSERTEAEKRIDQIRAEVEKVLERLGQMEVET
jgi:hypothetical protein